MRCTTILTLAFVTLETFVYAVPLGLIQNEIDLHNRSFKKDMRLLPRVFEEVENEHSNTEIPGSRTHEAEGQQPGHDDDSSDSSEDDPKWKAFHVAGQAVKDALKKYDDAETESKRTYKLYTAAVEALDKDKTNTKLDDERKEALRIANLAYLALQTAKNTLDRTRRDENTAWDAIRAEWKPKEVIFDEW